MRRYAPANPSIDAAAAWQPPTNPSVRRRRQGSSPVSGRLGMVREVEVIYERRDIEIAPGRQELQGWRALTFASMAASPRYGQGFASSAILIA